MTHSEQDVERAFRKWWPTNQAVGTNSLDARLGFIEGYRAALDAMGPREAVSREQVEKVLGKEFDYKPTVDRLTDAILALLQIQAPPGERLENRTVTGVETFQNNLRDRAMAPFRTPAPEREVVTVEQWDKEFLNRDAFPNLEWKFSEDGMTGQAFTDVGPYVHSVLNGLAGKIDELLAAGIIPMLERGGHLAAHDAEVLRNAVESMNDLLDCSGDTRWKPRLLELADSVAEADRD